MLARRRSWTTSPCRVPKASGGTQDKASGCQDAGRASPLATPRCGYGEAVTTNQDRWARWVLQRRDAGDVQVRQRGASLLAAYRDGVLDRAAVTDGDVLLDVGTGDGLIAFPAPDGRGRPVGSLPVRAARR